MTTKKVQKQGASRKSRPSVKTRARAIVADVDAYDEDTRHAIKNALDGDGSDLSELVRRAEAGETILDVSNPLRLARPAVCVRYEPWESDAATFEHYQQDGRFFAAILADPACPENFRRLFGAVWRDDLLGSVIDKLGNPHLLPLTFAIVRDVMDASNLCGTAEGIYKTLITAVETLVPDEVADRARGAMQKGGE
ncbi:MAG TPA: hypothetical protein VF659_24185 [Pyrinomonadaceae bacterium]|jgi:hypothetical protein